MISAKSGGLILGLCLIFSITACRTQSDNSGTHSTTEKVSEIGSPLVSGSTVLNVSGAGYFIGDIVRIRTKVTEFGKGDVILFDWRKAVNEPGGFGPAYMIGRVIGLPGEQLEMSALQNYRGQDGKEKETWFDTFRRRGAESYESNITLSAGDYLVETENNILIADEASIGAKIVERLGHDDQAEKEIKQRVY